MSITLYNPVVSQRMGRDTLATRPGSMRGKTVGLLWNSKPNADLFLETMADMFARRDPSLRFVRQSKPTASKPMAPEVLEAMKACDVAITAFGD
jgi:hypothetical protein